MTFLTYPLLLSIVFLGFIYVVIFVSTSLLFLMSNNISLYGWYYSVFISWCMFGLFLVAIQSLSCVWLSYSMDCSMPGFPVLSISWTLLKFMSIKSVMLSNQLILCHHLLLLPSVFPSIRVFSSELALHIRWPKYWSFSISPSSE